MSNVIYYDDLIQELEFKIQTKQATQQEFNRYLKLLEWLENEIKEA